MPRLAHMEQRLEFLELGEKLGWPRIMRLRAGKGNWEGMARAEHRRFIPLLRAAKIRVENQHGELESELARTVTYGDIVRGLAESPVVGDGQIIKQMASQALDEHRQLMAEGMPTLVVNSPEEMVKVPRYTSEMRRANLAKAREVKKARAAVL